MCVFLARGSPAHGISGPLGGEGNPSDLGNLVELAKELIEHEYQLLRGTLAGQPREAHDVRIQHTVQGELC